jgi:hypothetical protein
MATATTSNDGAGIPNVQFRRRSAIKNLQPFLDAADDVVLVRILHGIHFRFADEDGRNLGRTVAQWLFGHFCKPLE